MVVTRRLGGGGRIRNLTWRAVDELTADERSTNDRRTIDVGSTVALARRCRRSRVTGQGSQRPTTVETGNQVPTESAS